MFDVLEDPPFLLRLVFMLFIGFLAVIAASTGVKSTKTTDELEQKIRVTPAGNFALDTFENCKARGWFSSPAEATCVDETIRTAQTLRGTVFADEVKEALAHKLVQSLDN